MGSYLENNLSSEPRDLSLTQPLDIGGLDLSQTQSHSSFS